MIQTRSNAMLTLMAALLLGTACGDPVATPRYRGEPLATLHGQLTTSQPIDVQGGVRLAIVWFRPPTAEVAPSGAKPSFGEPVMISQDVVYQGNFPINWQFSLYAPPPKDVALGVLVAYSDRNHNGQLDIIPADGKPIDKVLGASADWEDLEAGTYIVYLASVPADNAEQEGHPPQAGYNLIQDGAVVPLSTRIVLNLSTDPLLDFWACDNYSRPYPTSVDYVCGIQLHNPEQLDFSGMVLLNDGQASVSINVRAGAQPVGDATVVLDGRTLPYDPALGYFLIEDQSASIVPGRTLWLRVSRPGSEVAAMEVRLPGDFQITSPEAGARLPGGQELPIAWTKSAGADCYFAAVVANDGSFNHGQSTETPGLSMLTPAGAGATTLTVHASLNNSGVGYVFTDVSHSREVFLE